jgi:hypothetical protein
LKQFSTADGGAGGWKVRKKIKGRPEKQNACVDNQHRRFYLAV